MIRNMQKVGTVQVADGNSEPLEIDIKHKGTFGRFLYQGWNGGAKCAGTTLEGRGWLQKKWSEKASVL